MPVGGIIREPIVHSVTVTDPETGEETQGAQVRVRQQRRRINPVESTQDILDVKVGTFAGPPDDIGQAVDLFLASNFDDTSYPANEQLFTEDDRGPLIQSLAQSGFPEADVA